MATKNEISKVAGAEVASAQVNNSYINGIVEVIKEKERLGLSFPAGYNYNNELLGAYLIMSETLGVDKKPIIESCTKQSIVQTMIDMVTLGVSMQKKQCYPIPYGNKLICQMSVYGNTCIARRYGLKQISAQVIYEGDEFSYHIENGEIVIDKHTQDFMRIDPDKIVGAYAVAVMNDGYTHIEIMNMPMIRKAWRQGRGYSDKGEGVHQKFPDQMAMKTVKNRCLKYIIRTYGTDMAAGTIDDMDNQDNGNKVVMDTAYEIGASANSVVFDVEDTEPEVIDYDDVAPEVVEASTPDFLND